MMNDELKEALLQKYGLQDTTKFCDMVAYMYSQMCNDWQERFPDEPCEYEYEQLEWERIHKQLINIPKY